MPTMTETEDRLRNTLNVVASSVHDSDEMALDIDGVAVPMATPSAGRGSGRSRRHRPSFVFAASFLVVLLLGSIGFLMSGLEPTGELDRVADSAIASTAPSSPDESTSISNTLSAEESATAEFWALTLAGLVDSVNTWDEFGPDTPEPEAIVVESHETGDPFGGGGSLLASVVTEDDQMTIRAEYVGRREPIDESGLQVEIAELTSGETVEHVTTIWHAPDEESESVQAEYFLTEVEPGSTRVTVLTALGRLTVDVETTDPTLSYTVDQHIAIATGMSGTSLDLTWNPDHPLSVEVVPLPEPAADDWLALDGDLWVAWVAEGEDERLWVKTDIQGPSSANSTDTRSIHAFAGSQFVVIVVGEPVPDFITVTWDDRSADSVKPTWNTDLDMGFARFDIGGRELVSVDGT